MNFDDFSHGYCLLLWKAWNFSVLRLKPPTKRNIPIFGRRKIFVTRWCIFHVNFYWITMKWCWGFIICIWDPCRMLAANIDDLYIYRTHTHTHTVRQTTSSTTKVYGKSCERVYKTMNVLCVGGVSGNGIVWLRWIKAYFYVKMVALCQVFWKFSLICWRYPETVFKMKNGCAPDNQHAKTF